MVSKRQVGRLVLLIVLTVLILSPLYGTVDALLVTDNQGAAMETKAAATNSAANKVKILSSDGYQLVQESSTLELLVNANGDVIVKDKRNKHLWRSTPEQQYLDKETVKGHWRRNLESPFYLEYVDVLQGGTKVKYGNAEELKAKATISNSDQGVEITYDLQAIESSITYVISIKDDHMEVYIPADRVIEKENIRIVNLWVLPFLGAAQSSVTDGHMFVPDGMGAIIPFEKNSSYPFRYSAEIYGSDIAVSRQYFRNNWGRKAESLLPVFGISYGENAVLGIIAEGDSIANVHATPSGLYTTFNWISPQLVYRNEYFKRTSSFGQGFNVYETAMNKLDRRIRYYFLQGEEEEINYVGMATAYRSFLIEERGLTRKQYTSDHLPLDLYFFGGDLEPSIFGTSLVTTTTFDQAREIVDQLEASGVAEMDVTFMGWNDGGYTVTKPDRFPAEKKLGGDDGLSRLVEDMHRRGQKLYLEDNYVDAFSGNKFSARSNALRDSNGRVIEGRLPSRGFSFIKPTRKYWIQPSLSQAYVARNLPHFKEMGIDGLSFDRMAGIIYSDNNPTSLYTREDTIGVFRDLLDEARLELGNVRVTHGNAYVLGHVDHISLFPLSASYDLLARETVPFYPIAIHGLVSYSASPGNLRDENKRDYLKSIEYGALPAYLLTYDDSILLKDTYTKWIFSSQYNNWVNTIAKEYQRMDTGLHDVQNHYITNHRELDPGVFETSYDNGTRVYVNYNATSYSKGNINIAPYDFTVLQGGG